VKSNQDHLELRVVEIVVEVVHLPSDDDAGQLASLVDVVREDLVDTLHWAHAVGVKLGRRGRLVTSDAREGAVEWDRPTLEEALESRRLARYRLEQAEALVRDLEAGQ
jgi:hypothetical protein